MADGKNITPIILKSGETYYLHIEEETGGGRENTD
jgi:hypothetical protein